MAAFSPIERRDGYLRIGDHGLIGDGSTAALVGRDGAISWMCLPRFDSPPIFCRLLDRARGGALTVTLADAVESLQYYHDNSAVLSTVIRGRSATIRVTDALLLRSGADLTEDAAACRQELMRMVTVLEGEAHLVFEIDPFQGARAERSGGGLRIRCNGRTDVELYASASFPLEGLRATPIMRAGERAHLLLSWSQAGHRYRTFSPDALLDQTEAAWQRWLQHFRYEGPQRKLVERSAVVLKLLDYFENGAILAAPTSSLPERIGGVRNWDYRYSWIRDAAFSVYALHRIGFFHEAGSFLNWVLHGWEPGSRPRVLYNLDGKVPPPEQVDDRLEGYRGSKPVRWGNAAAEQIQHDVFGEILDCAYQYARHHGSVEPPLWEKLQSFVEAAAREWHTPDQGIWEVRTAGRPFTYSAALCHVALDRGARLAEHFGLKGDVERWRGEAARIRERILNGAWNPRRKAIAEHLDGGGLDASLLALPLRRVIEARHPRMVSTVEAIVKRLGAGKGLLYRYLPEESPDGLPGHEGAFLLCSFWLVDNLSGQGRIQEAMDLYDSLCARAGELGLLPEEVDATTGEFLGNYPQAFSHIGVISSGVRLSRLAVERRDQSPATSTTIAS
ncbi:MAG: glycoside hydrolase family 15 protein [Bryobacteraceae bacterium]